MRVGDENVGEVEDWILEELVVTTEIVVPELPLDGNGSVAGGQAINLGNGKAMDNGWMDKGDGNEIVIGKSEEVEGVGIGRVSQSP